MEIDSIRSAGNDHGKDGSSLLIEMRNFSKRVRGKRFDQRYSKPLGSAEKILSYFKVSYSFLAQNGWQGLAPPPKADLAPQLFAGHRGG